MTRKVYLGENLSVLSTISDESVDLVYIDPPFNTGKTRKRREEKFTRVWDEGDRQGFGGNQYLVEAIGSALSYGDSFDDFLGFIHERLVEIYRVLKPSGCLYLHLDYREAPYVRILGDAIFGRDNFLNEIIWAYDYGGKPKTRWPAKHSNILFWVKDRKQYYWNDEEVDRIPYMAPGLVTAEKAARGKKCTDCYSEDTEVLSENGWVAFQDLREGIPLATVSSRRELSFVVPDKLYSYRYEGEMVHLHSKTVDLLVTPNHRMYVRPKRGDHYQFVAASDLHQHGQYVHLMNHLSWSGEDTKEFTPPPVSYYRAGSPLPSFDMGDWCEFMGWYISEGSTVQYRDRREVHITQLKPDHRPALEALLTRMTFNWHYNGRSYVICNKQLTVYLAELGKASQKYIPPELLRLPPFRLLRLYTGLMCGDGHVQKRKVGEQWKYFTSSPRLGDQVHELIIKLGWNASTYVSPPEKEGWLPKHTIVRRTAKESTIWRDRHISRVSYHGMVYCATVSPHHTLVVRRNGKSAVCGNCWWHTIVSPTGKEKTGYPTQKPLGIIERIIKASSPPDGLVLDCFAGSGTTGEAAAKLGRDFILVDKNPEAVAVMKKRLRPYSTKERPIRFIRLRKKKEVA